MTSIAKPHRFVVRSGLATMLALAALRPALAEPATELAGLFMQACMTFAGNPAQLRSWAASTGLPQLPEPARTLFLHGAKGVAFDASVPPEKYVLVSSDDGLCSALTDQVRGKSVIEALEANLKAAGIAFRLAITRDDKHEPAIQNQEYLAVKNGHGWRILAATVRDPQGGQAMLTAAPE